MRFSAGQANIDIAMKKAKTRIIRFLETEIWRLDKSDLPTVRALLLKPMRVLLLTVQGYVRDDCALRASALTFYSLLAVVPVAAMAFGIAKGFGLEQRLEKMFYQQLAGQEVVVDKIITFARSLLANTQGGLIAGIGVVLLFWSAVKVLNHIEGTLNDIWKVQSRSFVRKFTDYLAILVIGPLLVILSSSINLFIMAQVEAITGRLALLKISQPGDLCDAQMAVLRIDLAPVHSHLYRSAQHARSVFLGPAGRHLRRYAVSNHPMGLYPPPGVSFQL